MALIVRIDQIKTDDLEPTISITTPRTPRPFPLPATHVCRLTGAVISAERADGYASILNAGGSDSKFLLTTKLQEVLSALSAMGLSITAVQTAISGTTLDPAQYTPSATVSAWATRSTALATGSSKNVTGSGHDAGGESV